MIFFWFLFYENCFDELIRNKTKINKKWKEKEIKCKLWGVLTPNEEVDWWTLAQQEEAPCWLFGSCGEPLTDAYGGWQVVATGWTIWDTWQAEVLGVWWSLGWKLHGNELNKIIEVMWGDLGFEPRSQYLPMQAFTKWAINALCSWNRKQII